MNKRMVWMLVGCVIVFGTVFGLKFYGNKAMNEAMNNTPPPAAAVSTATAHQDTWAQSLEAVGTVKAINGVAVTTQAAGQVEKIHFTPGDRIDQGEVLVTLDHRTDQARLAAAQANARLAEQEYQRFKRLYQQGSVSKSQLDGRQAQRDQTRAQVETLRAQLRHKTVRAPFSGELGLRQVNLGQYLQPGTAIVNLQQLSPIQVDFSLPEKHLARLSRALPVQVHLDAYPGRTFEGQISALEPGVDAATRNIRVQATLPNEERLLRPGMFAKVRIQLPQQDQVVVIPRTAVAYAPYGNAVFIVNNDGDGNHTVKKTFVKLGRQRGDLVAVTEGLSPGDVVASSGLLKLRNNGRVTIENDVKPSAKANPQPANS